MKNSKQFVREIIPIIFGILIALFINNWNQDRRDKKYINQIFSSIKKEFTETNESIVNNMSLQKTLVDTLDLYLSNTKLSLLDITIKANGIYIPSIRMNSWKAISNSRIELIDYDKLSSLTSIEEGKNILNTKTEKLTDFMFLNINDKSKDKKEFMRILMLDIIGTEKQIKKEIDEYLTNEQVDL